MSENTSKLQGVEVIDDTIRKYNDAEYFASIIGYTGKISTEEYESLSADNDNYTLNDVVGKAGIEQVMDASLQGTKGYEKALCRLSWKSGGGFGTRGAFCRK